MKKKKYKREENGIKLNEHVNLFRSKKKKRENEKCKKKQRKKEKKMRFIV